MKSINFIIMAMLHDVRRADLLISLIIKPVREKTNSLGFRPGLIQTRL